jgi:hypothetical protein
LLLMGKHADALAEAVKETEEVSRLLDLALVYWAMDRRSDARYKALVRKMNLPD